MTKVIDLNPSVSKAGHRLDPLGVCAVCFASLLRTLTDAYDLAHPVSVGHRDDMLAYTSRTGQRDTNVSHNRRLLCERSGVPARRFQAYLSAEFATVSLADADSLLAAFDRTDLFASLTPLLRTKHVPRTGHACEVLVHVTDFGTTTCRSEGGPGVLVESVDLRIPGSGLSAERPARATDCSVSQTAA